MSTPVTSTKSINSTSSEAQRVNSTQNQRSQFATNGDSTSQPPAQDSTTGGGKGLDEEGYPPQKHAGAVGLGPEYGKMREATASDKIAGLKDELVGKITHNPDKVQHGYEQRTGELKRKKLEEGDNADPFNTAGADEKGDDKANSGTDKAAGNAAPTSVTDKRGPGTYPTEAGAQEQAATTAPEGTQEAEKQRQGENTYADKQFDERGAK